MAKPVKITETVLRDAHQSLIATRMTTEEMLPIVPKMDEIGYRAVECWGGATFDAALRFLHEDPWERLRKFRAGFKKTKLQMLFRGQNILGYKPYPDDVVEYFVQKSVANGIDIIRIFDCLNDLRNLEACVNAAKKEKGADYVAGFNSLSEKQKARYDRAAISRHYLNFMRLLGEISLLCAVLAHWIGLWAFVANLALLLACCAPEMHIDWEKAFEKYKLNIQPKGF